METPTNGELKIMLTNLVDRYEEHYGNIQSAIKDIHLDVKETKAQTIRTNGRVNLLEERLKGYEENMKLLQEIKWWKYYFIAGVGLAATILGFILKIVIK